MRQMRDFETKRLPEERDALAPDGSDVRVLLRLASGSMAHYELAAGHTSLAVTNQTVEEIWFSIHSKTGLHLPANSNARSTACSSDNLRPLAHASANVLCVSCDRMRATSRSYSRRDTGATGD